MIGRGHALPVDRIGPVGGVRIPPEGVVPEPVGLLESGGIRHAARSRGSEVVDAALGMDDRHIRKFSVDAIEGVLIDLERARVPVDGHAENVGSRLGIREDHVGPVFQTITVLVVDKQSRVCVGAACQLRPQVCLDEIVLGLGREVQALPVAAIAMGLIHRRQPPHIHARRRVGVEVPDEIVGIDGLVLRLQLAPCALPAVLLGAGNEPRLDVLHPGRGGPGRGDDPQFVAPLLLLDGERLADHRQQVVVRIPHTRMLRWIETGLVRCDRESFQSGVVRTLGVGVLPLHREVARADVRAGQGEVRTLLAENPPHDLPPPLGLEVGQNKRRRFGEGGADPVDGLLGAVRPDRNDCAGCRTRRELDVLHEFHGGSSLGGNEDFGCGRWGGCEIPIN